MRIITVVNPNNSLFVWKYAEPIDEGSFKVSVPIGYESVVVADGEVDMLFEGSSKEFSQKRGLLGVRKISHEIYFIKKHINSPIEWGIGGVSYTDSENKNREFGANGTLFISAQNPEKLVRSVTGLGMEVSPDDVMRLLESKFVSVAKSAMSSRCADLLKDWQKTNSANEIRDELFEVFNEYGISLDDFCIAEIY